MGRSERSDAPVEFAAGGKGKQCEQQRGGQFQARYLDVSTTRAGRMPALGRLGLEFDWNSQEV